MTPEQAEAVYRRADRLYSLGEVERAVDLMAGRMTERLRGLNPLVLCVMNGAVVPFGRLVSRMDFPMEMDYVHATRYRGETSGGALHWIRRPDRCLQDREVVIVDDILDEGLTLQTLVEACRAEGARAVHTAVVAVKRRERRVALTSDFGALEVEDRYVFGYGMDYKGYLRNAPGIFAVVD
ncbi:MAG: hypoxanthine-guanine phosphoribosyltransferase [Chromatiales bacterium]